MMPIKDLMEEIREGLPPSSWSNAVLAVRQAEVAFVERHGSRFLYDVHMDRALPYRVELDLEFGEWTCACRVQDRPCAHAAAAVLALYHSHKEGPLPAAKPLGQAGPYLRHVLRTSDRSWTVETWRVDPTQPDRATQLHGPPPPDVEQTAGDRQVLALLRGGLSGDRLRLLLEALAQCRDVWVDGLKVGVSADLLRPAVVIEDHPRGMIAHLDSPEEVHKRLPGDARLLVVGNPPTLRQLGNSTLSALEQELYTRGRIFRGDQAERFLAEGVPSLRSKTLVVIRTGLQRSRSTEPPYARMTLLEAAGGFDVLPSITYGRPPQAVVVNDQLHPLAGARALPLRNRDLERPHANHLARLGFTPGVRAQLRGLEAARFIDRVLLRFRGEVEGRAIAERCRIHEVPLRPRWELDQATGRPMLHFSVPGEGPGDPQLEATSEALLEAWRLGTELVPLLDGGFARLPTDWMGQYGAVLEALLEASETLPEGYRAALLAPLLDAVARDGASDDEALGPVRQALKMRLELKASPPARLKATLRPYQLEGLAWLLRLDREGLGGILADDMGLGKTLQTLALLLEDGPDAGPSLVIAPTSVLDNWRQEARRFAPSLEVRLYHGSNRSLEPVLPGELLITSYALLRLDRDALGAIPWHRVILDEAQAIKNPDSQVAQAARSLLARHRLVLTGTPVENRLQELWSLIEFLNPGLLGSRKRFEEQFTAPALAGDRTAIQRLRARVQPFILRRLKQQVATELPPKTEVVLKATLSREERKIYEALRVAGRAEVQKLLKEKGLRGGKFQMLEVLLRLRQACCHPGLVPGAHVPGMEGSAKLRLLLEQLEVILAEGHKALVFSQWTGLLDRVEPLLQAAQIPWVRLDGSTRDRAGVVARFQAEDGPGIFLISLKAGGTGLNLTAADYVYHLDPWWNPAVEEQATDRAYRIGQTRPVVTTRLIAAHTIEERVQKLQERKRAVADAALGGEDAWLEALSEQDLEQLLTE